MAQEKSSDIASVVSDYIGWCARKMTEEIGTFYRFQAENISYFTETYNAIGISLFNIGVETAKPIYREMRKMQYDTREVKVPFVEEIKPEEKAVSQNYVPLDAIPQAEILPGILVKSHG